MKKFLLLFLLISSAISFGQKVRQDSLLIMDSPFNVSAGMGLRVIYVKDVVSYLNNYIPLHTDEFKSVATAPDFYFNCEYRFYRQYGLKFDYGYTVKTYNLENTSDLLFHNISVTYSIHSPSLVFNYILREPGYQLKFGAGLSFNYARLLQKTSASRGEDIYISNGLGFKLDAYGHSQLDSKFYMVFGLFIHTGLMSDLKNEEGKYLIEHKKINMSFISVGLNLGMAYYF